MNDKPTEIKKREQTSMQLLHYFITVENYTPMVVRNVENEIWLENIDAPYRIIRINMNYIHNDEQLEYDMLKVDSIVKQVKRKTLSFSVNTLNILLNVGYSVKLKNENKNIDNIIIDCEESLTKSKELNNLYPKLKNNLVDDNDDVEFIMNITNDINKKTDKENKKYSRLFGSGKPFVTYFLIGINIVVYLVCLIASFMGKDFYTPLALNRDYVRSGEIYRLITSAFLHQNFFHIAANMYSLYIIGPQVERFVGKKKYIIIYLLSAIGAGLLSCVINPGWALGASGAIFGLLGTLLYYGLHYRLYLRDALRTQIIPVIVLNLVIGFLVPGIDNAAHIGGLVAGLFTTMALGTGENENKSDRINGTICLIILIAVLSYILFFR